MAKFKKDIVYPRGKANTLIKRRYPQYIRTHGGIVLLYKVMGKRAIYKYGNGLQHSAHIESKGELGELFRYNVTEPPTVREVLDIIRRRKAYEKRRDSVRRGDYGIQWVAVSV